MYMSFGPTCVGREWLHKLNVHPTAHRTNQTRGMGQQESGAASDEGTAQRLSDDSDPDEGEAGGGHFRKGPWLSLCSAVDCPIAEEGASDSKGGLNGGASCRLLVGRPVSCDVLSLRPQYREDHVSVILRKTHLLLQSWHIKQSRAVLLYFGRLVDTVYPLATSTHSSRNSSAVKKSPPRPDDSG